MHCGHPTVRIGRVVSGGSWASGEIIDVGCSSAANVTEARTEPHTIRTDAGHLIDCDRARLEEPASPLADEPTQSEPATGSRPVRRTSVVGRPCEVAARLPGPRAQ